MLNIIGKRKIAYLVSGPVMILSIIALSVWGLNLGIDFVGGTSIKVEASENASITRDTLCEHLSSDICTESFQVLSSDGRESIIKYRYSDEAVNKQVLDAVTIVDENVTILQTDFISGTVSEQLKSDTLTAIILAIVVILVYIALTFRKISFPVSSWSYGVCAVIALAHDVLFVLGLFAIFGHFLDVEVGVAFVAALLTILGYSVNDTIVVYDRVRENILRTRNTEKFMDIVNESLNETLARSMNTSLTVAVVLLAIIFWGSASLTWFAIALLIGIMAGTYSSIFIASGLIITIFEYKKKKHLLSK